MSRSKGMLFHHRFYRYLRAMLRRYPAMREQSLGLYCGADAVCGKGHGMRVVLRAAAPSTDKEPLVEGRAKP